MEFPEGLANNPFVTIPFGIIIGFILNTISKYWKNKKETEENRFNLLLGNCHGRITYEELIA